MWSKLKNKVEIFGQNSPPFSATYTVQVVKKADCCFRKFLNLVLSDMKVQRLLNYSPPDETHNRQQLWIEHLLLWPDVANSNQFSALFGSVLRIQIYHNSQFQNCFLIKTEMVHRPVLVFTPFQVNLGYFLVCLVGICKPGRQPSG